MVTGTNGKTLTTALTVGILKEVYGQVLTNPSGANMITGIATTFLTAKSSKTGKNIAVLEIDEASLSRICDYIQPSLFVITNIFRDQMDRQRQNDGIAHVAAGQSALVPAGRILSAVDLVNGNLSPSELVTIALIPSSGVIDTGK